MVTGNIVEFEYIIESLGEMEKEYEIKVVLIVESGSVAMGTTSYYSDRDIVCFYVKKDFIDKKITFPNEMKLREIVSQNHGFTLRDRKLDIELRELTSHIWMCVNPSVEHSNINCGRFDVFARLLMSPYCWDPYGLRMKIIPLIEAMSKNDYILYSGMDGLKKRNMENEISIKPYFKNEIIKALRMEWALNYNSLPPVFLPTLLKSCTQAVVVEAIEKLLEYYRRIILEKHKEDGITHIMHTIIVTKRIDVIEAYFDEMIVRAEKKVPSFPEVDKDKDVKKVYDIYDILHSALYQYDGQEVKDINFYKDNNMKFDKERFII